MDSYTPVPGVNDLGAFALDDAPNPAATPHRIAHIGDTHRGQATCQDCAWKTAPGDPDYAEHASRHADATDVQVELTETLTWVVPARQLHQLTSGEVHADVDARVRAWLAEREEGLGDRPGLDRLESATFEYDLFTAPASQ